MVKVEHRVSETDVQELTTADRFAVCERESRLVVTRKRGNGSTHYMTYKTSERALVGLGVAAYDLSETELMVVDRHAE